MARRFRIALTAAAALVLLFALLVVTLLVASLPEREGSATIAGLRDRVTVGFDRYARPRVEARTLEDAFAAQGWLHANDRLFQMEQLRRAGRGHLAQLFGRDLLEDDEGLWRAGVPQLARRLERNASPRLRRLVASYVAGINARIRAYDVPPPEFVLLRAAPRAWTPRDVYAVVALTTFQTANNAENELVRLALRSQLPPSRFALFLPERDPSGDYPYVLPEQQQASVLRTAQRMAALTGTEWGPVPSAKLGSNGWVVAAEKSTTGTPLFAFDSHDDLSAPGLFYEVHLFFGRGRMIRGWSVPGMPGVINGYNERIAWGLTNTGDTQDLFVETRSPVDPAFFRQDGRWYRARSETARIPLPGGGYSPLTIFHTRNGPLISEAPAVSLAWTAHEIGDRGFDALIDLNLAQNWVEFEQAADRIAAPATNATYADARGTIGFRTIGLLPQRSRGRGLYPLSGEASANGWRGLVPPSKNPSRANPADGYLAAANARVQSELGNTLVSADNAPAYRIARIRRVLEEARRLAPADMQRLQMDWYDTQAAWLLPAMLPALREPRLQGAERRAAAILANWARDPHDHPDEAGPLIFQQWYLEIGRAVFAPVIGDDLFGRIRKRNYLLNDPLDRLIIREPNNLWWRGRRERILRRTFRAAIARLGREHGHDPAEWRYGAAHGLKLRHELAGDLPLLGRLFDVGGGAWGGGPATVGRAAYRYDRPFETTLAATVRVAGSVPPTGPDLASVIPGGQSGHPLSRNYRDQHAAYRQGGLLPSDGAMVKSALLLLPAPPASE